MIRLVFPLGFAVVMLLLVKFVINPEAEPMGLIVAMALGLGIGAILNCIIFKDKNQDNKKPIEK